MRLACVDGDGEIVDFENALQQQPYTIRGLLADALAHCYRILPDSLEFLRAEGEVREALRTFQGDQDRYARGYVLSRTLDSRAQQTPRADLILLALHRGGPLALVGMFYATIDAHRKPSHRDTLDYLLNRATDESKLQLIMRSSTFPCNPSISSWLVRIFERLRPNAQNLACILRCLGTSNVPQALFRRLWMSSLSWGANGEPVESKAHMIKSVSDERKFTDALRDLEYVGFIRISPTTIDLDMRISEFLRLEFEDPRWIAEAVRILAHAFPKHRPLEPTSYIEMCKILQPPLETVFSYLKHVPLGSLAVERQCLEQFIEVCLSASYFRDKPWKLKAISIVMEASSVLKHSFSENSFLTAAIDVRKSSLSLIYQERSQKVSRIVIPTVDHRSRALSADVAILNARECVSLSTLASALEYLAGFDPSWQGCVSTLGAIQGREVILMRARILRFTGRFQEAYALIETMPPDDRTLPIIGALLCELGRCDETIRLLSTQVTGRGGIVRVRIALAHAYLLKCMQCHVQDQPLDWRSLQVTRTMFQELLSGFKAASYFSRMDHLSILIGIATIHHMDGQLDYALEGWQKALAASQQYLSPGYTDMIIYYSMSELESRRAASARSDMLENQARDLFARTGRQYHFVGLGSMWPEIIGKSLVARGRRPVIPLMIHQT
ncbi:uncharacterized protein F4807DRAFT_173722 [Annulohypoxylon truncatum]|uniref:uncharacterized protein n=1 Tax=Annulohypoxylon truncatum TaxID=327061 RepID=UPI0020087E64|nr:uncharacterized protein F4807DRAFT_173722 [Annulohypoxylon truncatum]KAI1207664.1 hypothetical protein F4807DRAFT_173722 [Annulohypoxylon truncatum]